MPSVNDLDIQAGGAAALANVTMLIAQGYNSGAWTGTGITSSAAANDNSHLTAAGVILNKISGSTPLYTSLDGAVAVNDVLVKYTYYGDTNLDGKIDGTDYSRLDNGYQSAGTLSGWFNGDFNYDGAIDGSDYTLIDNAFNTQGAQLTAAIASPTAEIAGTSAVPEPTALGLMGIATAGLLGRRRPRRQ